MRVVRDGLSNRNPSPSCALRVDARYLAGHVTLGSRPWILATHAAGLESEIKVAIKAVVKDPAAAAGREGRLSSIASLADAIGIPPTADDVHLLASTDANIREGLISYGGSLMGERAGEDA